MIYKNKLLHFFYALFIAKPSGLLPTPADPRDFKTENLGWRLFGYTPKHTRHLIPTISIKDQGTFNTCQWNATVVQKEIDEQVRLSVRDLVARGKQQGMVSGDGFSNLRSGQQILKQFGVCEENLLPELGEWNSYVAVDLPRFQPNADTHKSQTYWSVSSIDDLLKLLDEGRVVTTGIDWFTGFNQGGGFSSPWIISKAVGYKVGGHAIAIIGYDQNYQGKKVFIIQNSYGSGWGDQGKFYITFDYLMANNYGFWTNLDIGLDVASFLNTYDGKNVKGSTNAIYFIQKGFKKPYLDEVSYCAFNPTDPMIITYTRVPDDILSKIPQGEKMDIEKSLYWDFLKDLTDNESRIQKLLEILRN